MSLFHRDFGGTGAPPFVILHGLLGSSRNWQTVGRELAAFRRCYALDLRNHGMSPHSGTMSYEAMAEDVAAWMDAQGIASAEVIGHSMGGKVAMLLACRHAARVSRLAVVDIAPRNYDGSVHAAEFSAMQGLDLGDLRSRADAEARMEGRISDWAMRKFLATNLERTPAGGWKWQINLPVLASSLSVLERNPLGAADRFEGPALFITGGKSGYVRTSDRDTILAHFPSARIQVIAGTGHNPHIDARDALVKAVASAG